MEKAGMKLPTWWACLTRLECFAHFKWVWFSAGHKVPSRILRLGDSQRANINSFTCVDRPVMRNLRITMLHASDQAVLENCHSKKVWVFISVYIFILLCHYRTFYVIQRHRYAFMSLMSFSWGWNYIYIYIYVTIYVNYMFREATNCWCVKEVEEISGQTDHHSEIPSLSLGDVIRLLQVFLYLDTHDTLR